MSVAFGSGLTTTFGSVVRVMPIIMSTSADICGCMVLSKISVWFLVVHSESIVFRGRACGEMGETLAPVSMQMLIGDLAFRRLLIAGKLPQ